MNKKSKMPKLIPIRLKLRICLVLLPIVFCMTYCKKKPKRFKDRTISGYLVDGSNDKAIEGFSMGIYKSVGSKTPVAELLQTANTNKDGFYSFKMDIEEGVSYYLYPHGLHPSAPKYNLYNWGKWFGYNNLLSENRRDTLFPYRQLNLRMVNDQNNPNRDIIKLYVQGASITTKPFSYTPNLKVQQLPHKEYFGTHLDTTLHFRMIHMIENKVQLWESRTGQFIEERSVVIDYSNPVNLEIRY